MSNAIRIGLVLLATASLACSQDDEAPPTSAFVSGTTGTATGSVDTTGATGGTGDTGASGSTGESGAFGSTGGLPTASPGSATGHVNGGTVSFKITGDIKVRRTLDQMVSTVYEQPPGGSLVLVWTAGESDVTTVGIGGASFTGTMPTSPTLALTLVVQTSSGVAAFQSRAGECGITIDVATKTQIAGTLRCTGFAGATGQVVNVSGSFQAEA